jgi:hypothetical protein
VPAAGKIVSELVDEEDAEQCTGESPTCNKKVRMLGQPAPGPQIASPGAFPRRSSA